MYIDCLLDSSIPHDLLNEYSEELDASAFRPSGVPDTVPEDHSESPVQSQEQHANHSGTASYGSVSPAGGTNGDSPVSAAAKHKHTPRDIFRRSESMPLLQDADDAVDGENADDRAEVSGPSPEDYAGPKPNLPWLEDAEVDSDDPIVTLAIWVNMVANIILLAGKIVVVASVPSMSVLASLVDAVLDFLSTAIIWTTTRLISAGQKDQSRYPVGRRRYELSAGSRPVYFRELLTFVWQIGAGWRSGIFHHHDYLFCASCSPVSPDSVRIESRHLAAGHTGDCHHGLHDCHQGCCVALVSHGQKLICSGPVG